MPLCTLALLSLQPHTSISAFLRSLRSNLPPQSQPIVTSRPVRWIITPEHLTIDELLHPLGPSGNNPTAPATAWDLLVIFPARVDLPAGVLSQTRACFVLTAGVPSSLLKGFAERNARLLRPEPGSVPALTEAARSPRMKDSTQRLELTDDLYKWAYGEWDAQGRKGKGAVSMLNFLAFKPGEEAHKSYQKYGQEFAKGIGSRRGGTAKVVGKVVGGEGPWEEIALAHYPSLKHFCDMAGSEDYQAVNVEYRLPSLKDTCILMTTELDSEVYEGGTGSKL